MKKLVRWLVPAIVLAAAWVVVPSLHAQQQPSVAPLLQVSIVGFRSRTGRAVVSLYDGSEGWLDVTHAAQVQRLAITGRDMLVTFPNLIRGHSYAVSVVHDENANDRMDMQWLPLPHPAEGAGASRNPRPTMGPPSWGDASFTLSDSRRILIELVY